MITLDDVFHTVAELRADDLQRWIDNEWVRPHGHPGAWQFEEIDIARIRLIVVLHYEFRVDEEALPIVLSLLDQLHDNRRQMQRLLDAMADFVPSETRLAIRARLQANPRLIP
jgi:chaperone modulatory protein CbpM